MYYMIWGGYGVIKCHFECGMGDVLGLLILNFYDDMVISQAACYSIRFDTEAAHSHCECSILPVLFDRHCCYVSSMTLLVLIRSL